MSMAAVADDKFARFMEPVARKLLGDPNARLSSASELRFGSHGSLSVDLELGVWADHEANTGGGVMDLLRRELKLDGQDAIAWLNTEVGGQFEDRRQAEKVTPLPRMVGAPYDYVDEHGELLFQVCRFEPKTFRQRRPDPSSRDGWSWSVKGVRLIPYRLPETLSAIAKGETIYVVEGEKDVENLAKEGVFATCNPMGASKWPETFAEHFRGADVVILPDNDDAGRQHASIVAANLQGVVGKLRILELPGLPPKGDVTDWLSQGGDLFQLTAIANTVPAWTRQAPVSNFGAIRWADLDNVTDRQDWLIDGLLFSGDVGMIYGASGSGKSFLAVHAGLCVARGLPFLGHDTRKGSVLYQAGEGGKGLVKRLRAYRQEHNITEALPFVLLPARVDLFSPDGDVDTFIAECLAWRAYLPEPLALIVIDTFSTASPGANENASEDMSRLIRAGEAINKATGAALLWVHHKNAAGDRERGHTSLRANIDTAIEVTKEEDSNIRTARLAKLKDGEDGFKIGFQLQTVTMGSYDDGKEITSCVVTPAQLETGQTSKRFRLPPGQAKFLKILDDAIIHRGGVIPPTAGAPIGSYGVQYHDFRELYVAIGGQGRSPEAVRQAIKLDGDKLFNAGLISRFDPWVWITERGGDWL